MEYYVSTYSPEESPMVDGEKVRGYVVDPLAPSTVSESGPETQAPLTIT